MGMANLTNHTDSPRAARKRKRDMRTVSVMVGVYCAGNHKNRERPHTSYAGEPLCAECAEIDAYANLRTRDCVRMEEKTTCDRCEIHCYTHAQLEKIREVMRYAGPRMMLRHPLAALQHLIGY